MADSEAQMSDIDEAAEVDVEMADDGDSGDAGKGGNGLCIAIVVVVILLVVVGIVALVVVTQCKTNPKVAKCIEAKLNQADAWCPLIVAKMEEKENKDYEDMEKKTGNEAAKPENWKEFFEAIATEKGVEEPKAKPDEANKEQPPAGTE